MKKRLEDKAFAILAIDAQQRSRPGYCADIATSMIDSELKLLARESIRHWKTESGAVFQRPKASRA